MFSDTPTPPNRSSEVETQTEPHLSIENDLSMNTLRVPNENHLLTFAFCPDFFPPHELVILTASDGGRKPVYGSNRHSYAGVFSMESTLNFCSIMTGPQNITYAEIIGCCHTLLRTRFIPAFDKDPPHIHVTDSMNGYMFMLDLQNASISGREGTNPSYNVMLCISDFHAELTDLVDLFRRRKNLRFKWVPSHTSNDSIFHKLNSAADKLTATALESYYGRLPAIATVEEERLRFNILPQAVRDLY